jgi:integrase
MSGMRGLTEEEIVKVREKLASKRNRYAARNELIFVLGLKTGFRAGELLSIKVGDVMRYEGKVCDSVTVTKRRIKGKTVGRTVPLHPEAKSLIKRWVTKAELKPEDYLFPSQKKDGTHLRRETVHDIFVEAFDVLRMGKGIGTHCMRKTFAQSVYKNLNYDIFATQHALGHKYISTTAIYLSVDDGKIKKAILDI